MILQYNYSFVNPVRSHASNGVKSVCHYCPWENSLFGGVSQADGPRGSAVPAGTDSDPQKENFPRDSYGASVEDVDKKFGFCYCGLLLCSFN